MARAALQLGVRELADAAGVSPTTIVRLESGESLYPRTVEGVRKVLEAQGVRFLPENRNGPGVRVRRRAQPGADCS